MTIFSRAPKKLVSERSNYNSSLLEGEIEVDESYPGGNRKGQRGCGAAGKTPVFGFLKKKGKGLHQGYKRCKINHFDANNSP